MEQIGRYEIVRELGRGGMAAVYLAQDPRFERQVAVKVLPANFMDDDNLRSRFDREAQTIASLEHYAIVPVYDYGEFEEQPFLVMRYMRGGSLSQRIGETPLSLSETVAILERITSALDAAHGKGIVHRDLKPDNILFDEYEAAYLSDFGIVKLAEATQHITATGGMVGTPAFMSPEQVRGDGQIDGRSDIYTLGVVLYQMLTADLPFEGDTPFSTAMKHVLDPVPAIREQNPELPAAIQPVIDKAMAKEPDGRYGSGAELVAALRAIEADPAVVPAAAAAAAAVTVLEPLPDPVASGEGRVATSDAVKEPEAKPKSRRGLLILILLLLFCLAGAAVAYGLREQLLAQAANMAAGTGRATETATATAVTSSETAEVEVGAGEEERPTTEATPSSSPSASPSTTGTATVEASPTGTAVSSSTATLEPTATATTMPSSTPTLAPSWTPTMEPSLTPTTEPSLTPTTEPSLTPTVPPTPTEPLVAVDTAGGRLTYRGSPVSGVTVALIEGACNASNVVQRVASDGDGRYEFSGVTPGSYTLAFNGWSGTGAVVDPYLSDCSWEVEKTAADEMVLNWSLKKNDLAITHPVNGATVATVMPVLTWASYPDAARYEVIILQKSPSSETVAWLEPVNSTSYQHPTPLTSGGTFDLIIWAYDNAGTQIATGSTTFSTP